MTTTKAVEKARAEVVRLMAVESDFARQRERALERANGVADGQETLEAALAGAGDGSKAATRASAKRSRAEAEAAALESAIVAARRVRSGAILAAWAAEAELKRQEAQTLRVTAGSLQVKIDGLLQRLEDESGVRYVPGPRAEYAGVGVVLDRALVFGVDSAPTQVDTLKVRAAALDEEARVLGLREVSRTGSASGADVAELFTAVASDPMSIGPTLADLGSWAQAAERPAREAWQAVRWREHLDASDAAWSAAGVAFTASWRVGRIVPSESSCTVTRQPAGVPPCEGNPRWVAGASYGR